MKKVIRTIAAAALLIATSTSMAKEPKLETNGISKSVDFQWEAQLLDASLKIYDENGTVVYSDYIEEADQYKKRFDLSPLGRGTYFLKIENGVQKITYSLRLDKENVFILGLEESVKPSFRRKMGRVYLNYLNKEMNEVEINVTDSSGNVLFRDKVANSFIVDKAFNFENALADDYTISVENGSETFYETITIK